MLFNRGVIMVDMTKVYYMTEAALFEKKHKHDVIETVGYRRKDYISLHILIVLTSVTLAFGIITGAAFFLVIMASSEIVLSVGQMAGIIAAIIALYLLVLILYYIISHKYYGEKHVKARQEVTVYLDILNDLKDYERAKRTLEQIE